MGAWNVDKIGIWIGIIGGIVSLISLPLSIYLYERSKVFTRMVYAIHPGRTVLKRSDFDKDLGFTYRGNPIAAEEITAIQLAIWNQGTQPINGDDVLDRVVLRTRPAVPILSVWVKKESRAICGFFPVLEDDALSAGMCEVRWHLLEPEDGVILQLIIAGGLNTELELSGVIRGQRRIEYIGSGDNARDWGLWWELISVIALAFTVVCGVIAYDIGVYLTAKSWVGGICATAGSIAAFLFSSGRVFAIERHRNPPFSRMFRSGRDAGRSIPWD